MPALISQSSVMLDTQTGEMTLVTSSAGTFVIRIARSGNSVDIIVQRDGTQVASTTIAQPSTADVENWMIANVEPLLGFQFRVHVTTYNPLVYSFSTFNNGYAIPTDWWVL